MREDLEADTRKQIKMAGTQISGKGGITELLPQAAVSAGSVVSPTMLPEMLGSQHHRHLVTHQYL